jgi:peptide-methionine (S)-S-oxide reductase
VGYCGGRKVGPTYYDLGDHTEALELDYDPAKLGFGQLAELVLRQSSYRRQSYSRQYRNAIFYHSQAEKQELLEIAKKFPEAQFDLEPLGTFYRAEDYHQKYYLQGSSLMSEYKKLYPDHKSFVDSTSATRANAIIDGNLGKLNLHNLVPKLGLSEKGQASLIRASGAPALQCQ